MQQSNSISQYRNIALTLVLTIDPDICGKEAESGTDPGNPSFFLGSIALNTYFNWTTPFTADSVIDNYQTFQSLSSIPNWSKEFPSLISENKGFINYDQVSSQSIPSPVTDQFTKQIDLRPKCPGT